MAERIRILSVPYDSGRHFARMGQGPVYLLGHELTDKVRQFGHQVAVTTIDHGIAFPTENAVAFELHGKIADAVRDSRAGREFPLILSGNCNYAAIGAVTGLGAEDTGVLWFDAHGECETPETTTSAFLDGMGMSILTGKCWKTRMAQVPGFEQLDPQRAVLVGARDLSKHEHSFVQKHQIGLVAVEDIRREGVSALAPQLERLRDLGVRRLYVHVDADVYDPETVGHANRFSATAGPGLSVAELHDSLQAISDTLPIHAAAITAYDPDVDPDGRMRGTLIDLAGQLSGLGHS